MNLDEIREQWEGKNPTIITEKEERIGGQLVGQLVVLRDEKQHDLYCCHRYFYIEGAGWQVSIDGKACQGEIVMKWLCDPCALTCRPLEEV